MPEGCTINLWQTLLVNCIATSLDDLDAAAWNHVRDSAQLFHPAEVHWELSNRAQEVNLLICGLQNCGLANHSHKSARIKRYMEHMDI